MVGKALEVVGTNYTYEESLDERHTRCTAEHADCRDLGNAADEAAEAASAASGLLFRPTRKGLHPTRKGLRS